MAKRVKTKKGSIGKRALSVVLSASMVMGMTLSTSGIVMAASAITANDKVVVTFADRSKEYDGSVIKPKVEKVTYGEAGTEITASTSQYTVSYDSEADEPGEKGKAIITFVGVGDEHAPEPVEYTVEKRSVVKEDLEVVWGNHTGFTYNGKEQAPEITAVILDKGNDGKVELPLVNFKRVAVDSATGIINAGKDKQVKVALSDTGKKNFVTDVESLNLESSLYNIDPAAFTEENVTVNVKDVKFTGSAVAPKVTVKDAGGNIVATKLTYFDSTGKEVSTCPNINIGEYTVRIRCASSNYDDKYIDKLYNIKGEDLDMKVKNALDDTTAGAAANVFGTNGTPKTDANTGEFYWEYNGKAPITDTIKNWISNVWLPKNDSETAYPAVPANVCKVDLSEASSAELGNYKIKIVSTNTYEGQTAEIPFSIRPRDIRSESATATDAAAADFRSGINSTISVGKTHDDKVSANTVVVLKDNNVGTNGTTLVRDQDYTVTTSTPKKVGNTYKVDVTVTGIGNYKGTVKKNGVEVGSMNLNDPLIEVTLDPASAAWTGKTIQPSATLKEAGNPESYTLVRGKDYSVKYGTNINVGKGTVILTGMGNYTGTREVEFDITGTDVNEVYELAELKDKHLNDSPLAYVAADLKVLFKSSGKSEALSKVVDVSKIKYYIDGVEAKNGATDVNQVKETCSVKIEVPATGQYSGNLTAEYDILGTDISSTAKIDTIADQSYTGEAIVPNVVVKNGTTLLVEGTDYEKTISNNKNVGMAVITVVFKGKYSGKIMDSFNITKVDATVALDDTQKSNLASGVAAGSTMGLNLVTTLADGKAIPDDTLTYTAESDATDIVGVDGTTLKFEKEGTANVTITPASSNLNLTPVSITVPVKVTAKAEKLTASCTPSRLKKVKNSFTVTTNTVKGADKWVIRYSLKNLNKTTKGSAKATFSDVNKVKQQVVKVNKSGAKYYVQCRVVKDGVKSAWSKVKTVKSR